MLTFFHAANLALRLAVEIATLYALGYWGFHTAYSSIGSWVLGLGAPVVVAVVWALFGSPAAAYPLKGGLHLLLELIIFQSGAVALLAAGFPRLAVFLGATALLNRLLMYYWHQ